MSFCLYKSIFRIRFLCIKPIHLLSIYMDKIVSFASNINLFSRCLIFYILDFSGTALQEIEFYYSNDSLSLDRWSSLPTISKHFQKIKS